MGLKRRLAARVINACRPVLMPVLGSRLRVLNYHRITYGGPEFVLDDAVISATPELFDRQVRFCVRHFDILSFRDLQHALDGRLQLPKRPLIITFDDGYEDNHRYAYPILRSHGASGTFFLAVDYIDTARLFWWDEVAWVFKRYDGQELEWRNGEGSPCRFDLTSPARRRASIKGALTLLKRVSDDERRATVAALKTRAGAPVVSDLPSRVTMTWAEVRDMVAGGMEVGSHSMSHPVLSRVDDQRMLRHETDESKRVLEAQIGKDVTVFSYPVGGIDTVTGRVVNAVRAAGYQFAVSYVNGLNRVDRTLDRFRLKRLHVDGMDEPEFRARVLLPQL